MICVFIRELEERRTPLRYIDRFAIFMFIETMR